MRRYVVLIGFAVLMSLGVAAQGDTQDTTINPQNTTLLNHSIGDEFNESLELEELQNVFNNHSERVPGFAASIVGDQTIHIELSEVEGLENESIGVKMEDMQISDIQWGEYNRTTLEISVSQENLEEIIESSDPMFTASQMLRDGDIEYRSLTVMNSVRFTLLRMFTDF